MEKASENAGGVPNSSRSRILPALFEGFVFYSLTSSSFDRAGGIAPSYWREKGAALPGKRSSGSPICIRVVQKGIMVVRNAKAQYGKTGSSSGKRDDLGVGKHSSLQIGTMERMGYTLFPVTRGNPEREGA